MSLGYRKLFGCCDLPIFQGLQPQGLPWSYCWLHMQQGEGHRGNHSTSAGGNCTRVNEESGGLHSCLCDILCDINVQRKFRKEVVT